MGDRGLGVRDLGLDRRSAEHFKDGSVGDRIEVPVLDRVKLMAAGSRVLKFAEREVRYLKFDLHISLRRFTRLSLFFGYTQLLGSRCA